jgi:pimeloyl-ACP methyl ester carboxylesterase
LVALVGCTSWNHGSRWTEGGKAPLIGAPHLKVAVHSTVAAPGDETLQSARQHFDLAESLAAENSPRCVDEFYCAAVLSWAEYRGALHQTISPDREQATALCLYHDSVGRLIHEAQNHGRLDPRTGLHVESGGVRRIIPIEFHDFAWSPLDFQQWIVVGSYDHRSISEVKANDGVGVPLVIVRRKLADAPHELDFLPPEATFAATATLEPDGSALVLHNPLKATAVSMSGEQFPMARDLTANIVWGLHHREWSPLEGFLQPNRAGEAGRLLFAEPYQPHKIPVIFVHGLLSSPETWAEIYNELRASPDLTETYQFWAYEYSTGAPFVRSAAELRSQLNAVHARFDPASNNPALRRVVLVGHSMGGLISKLMVSHSGEDVWNTVAYVPLESLVTNEATRARLAERLYFDPNPLVQRAVFIATPHKGSAVAGRAVGKVAGALVSESEPAYEQLRRDNFDLLNEAVTRRMPTSIDLLDPNQPFLDTVGRLRVSQCVTLHSIIGEGGHAISHGQSDGIVTVESARHAGVASELYVPASHSGILRHSATVDEIKRILRLHACQ